MSDKHFGRQPHAGVILAGGLGKRMGGGDKPLLTIGGKPMLDRVIARLAPQVERIIINANGDPARFAAYGLPVVADTIEGFAGPLAGVLAGMRWSKANLPEARFLVSVAADTPFFPDNLVPRLSEGCGNDEHTIALAASTAGTHPVFGLWPVALADELETFLKSGGSGKILTFADRLPQAQRALRRHHAAGRRDGGPVLQRQHARGRRARRGDRRGARPARRMTSPVFGVTGWKNSGKTTLLTRLVSEFTRRGYRVSTVKHAHHDFDIDKPATDSFRHREAGASEVMIVSGNRWALMHELRGDDEPPLEAALQRLSPCDLVLVEGYKREGHPKIEARRQAARRTRSAGARRPVDPGDRRRPPDRPAWAAGLRPRRRHAASPGSSRRLCR